MELAYSDCPTFCLVDKRLWVKNHLGFQAELVNEAKSRHGLSPNNCPRFGVSTGYAVG